MNNDCVSPYFSNSKYTKISNKNFVMKKSRNRDNEEFKIIVCLGFWVPLAFWVCAVSQTRRWAAQ